ncbi:hypothetical protein JTB14_018713 [Gonioctena quinquepunctata]|nr:hypothetical protein JTB14_018713 [Gonioctena quinquepunctata]
MRVYKTALQSTMMYTAETITKTKKSKGKVGVQETKILGPIKTLNNEYRCRINRDKPVELKEENVIKKIQRQGIRFTIYNLNGERRRSDQDLDGREE